MNALSKLPNGATGFTNDAGQWICTGSQMGRRDRLPSVVNGPIKMRLVQLRFVSGDYDKGGAYWGYTPGTAIYRGVSSVVQHFGDSLHYAELFVRANSRADAKAQVLAKLPGATFYR